MRRRDICLCTYITNPLYEQGRFNFNRGNSDMEREGDAGGVVQRREGGREKRESEKEKEKEKVRERDSSNETLADAGQSSQPPYNRSSDTGSDSQASQLQSHHHHHNNNNNDHHDNSHNNHHHQNQRDQQQQQQPPHHRAKHQKRAVGGGAGRFHARVSSSKGLHKSHSQSTTKLRSRANSPEPDRPPQSGNAHRRTTSDLKLTAISNPALHLQQLQQNYPLYSNSGSNSNSRSQSPSRVPLRKNTSHSNLPSKPTRPRPDIGKRSKSAAVIKRSSSHKDVQKLKKEKNQVHFDLGNDDDDADGNEDEWVDASASASPFLSRRGSVVSGGQSPAKPTSPNDNDDNNSSQPHSHSTADDRLSDHHHGDNSPTRETTRHNNYITSRLLQRTPSHGAPPQMSTEDVYVHPPSGSPTSQISRGPASLYGTPKTSTLGASGPEELISRFVNGSGPSSGGHGDDSYFIPSHEPLRRDEGDLRRPKSLGNLHQGSRDSLSEDERALAPRSKTSIHRAPPASQSRTQQKLNLQRASSTIEPAQAGPGVGPVGPSLLVGSSDYEHRDPRITRLLERTEMEYLVVRRYQNPIARSFARLAHLPGAATNNRRNIPKQNGNRTNGANTHGKNSLDTNGGERMGLSQSMTQLSQQRSRPTTPRRPTSIRTTTGVRSSFEAHEQDRPGLSGTSLVDESDNNLATLLRNLWDKSNDLGASQD
ncbi:hypothetical protein F5Y08DRAFT_329401 [Xylaria arbuscula]|nr:hypothetical protein F5Y08DRAFT_329401 [Xylaria arbuscula]